MINNISWASYWQAIVITLLTYYGFVLYLFYRKDILNLFVRNQRRFALQPIQSTQNKNQATDRANQNEIIETILSGPDEDGELLPILQSLIDEVVAYMDQVSYSKPAKEEIIFSLQQIIKKYPQVKLTSHLPAINNLLKFECENKSSVILDDNDINKVWLG